MIRRRGEIMVQIEEREGWIREYGERLAETRGGRLELASLSGELEALREELAERERLDARAPFREGQRSHALNPQLGRLVSMTFKVLPEYVTADGWVVRGALLGVCDETGDVVAVPAQSTPALGAARRTFEADAARNAADEEVGR